MAFVTVTHGDAHTYVIERGFGHEFGSAEPGWSTYTSRAFNAPVNGCSHAPDGQFIFAATSSRARGMSSRPSSRSYAFEH